MGEGNVFTGVCHSVHGGCLFPTCITGHMTRGGVCLLRGGAASEEEGGLPSEASEGGLPLREGGPAWRPPTEIRSTGGR